MADEMTYQQPVGVVTRPGTTKLKVVDLHVMVESDTIEAIAGGDNGIRFPARWTGTVGRDLIEFLNSGNFSTVHMQRRILQRMAQDGFIPAGGTDS